MTAAFRFLSLIAGTVLMAQASPAPKAAVAEVAYTFVGWALYNKHTEALLACPSHGEDVFLFQSSSRGPVPGFEARQKLIPDWMHPDFQATRTEIRDVKVGISKSGEAAWFSSILNDCGTHQGRESCRKDCHSSGVVEKREGRWVIVQAHFSLASGKVVEAFKKQQAEAGRMWAGFGSCLTPWTNQPGRPSSWAGPVRMQEVGAGKGLGFTLHAGVRVWAHTRLSGSSAASPSAEGRQHPLRSGSAQRAASISSTVRMRWLRLARLRMRWTRSGLGS